VPGLLLVWDVSHVRGVKSSARCFVCVYRNCGAVLGSLDDSGAVLVGENPRDSGTAVKRLWQAQYEVIDNRGISPILPLLCKSTHNV